MTRKKKTGKQIYCELMNSLFTAMVFLTLTLMMFSDITMPF